MNERDVLKDERRRDALDGQATMEECYNRIKELEKGLAGAIRELECSGYYFDHPSLIRLRKLIEKP